MAFVATSIAAAGMIAGGAMQYKASQDAKHMARAVAKYNADVDIAKAKQIDLDTQANIRSQRAEDKVFTSRQQTAYAMAGVLSSGSPLSVAATTAGRMEKRIQQAWTGAGHEQQMQYSAAKMGIAYGESQAKAYDLQGASAIAGTTANVGSLSANAAMASGK